MTRRRDEETGEFKYLACCKSCKAEYSKQYMMEKRWVEKQKEKRTGIKQEPCNPVYVEPKSRVCKCCKQEKPISEFYQKYQNSNGIWLYYWQCKECKREAYREKHGVKPVPTPPKLSVWDLTCMPKGLSVEDTVQLADEAFPLLSNQYWKAGEAQKIYKQFGMKWSYL